MAQWARGNAPDRGTVRKAKAGAGWRARNVHAGAKDERMKANQIRTKGGIVPARTCPAGQACPARSGRAGLPYDA